MTNNAVSVRSFGINVISQFKLNLALHPVCLVGRACWTLATQATRGWRTLGQQPAFRWTAAPVDPTTSVTLAEEVRTLVCGGGGGESKSALVLYIYSYKHYIWRLDLRVAPVLAGPPPSPGWVILVSRHRDTGRGVGGCLKGWSRAAIREGQAQLHWRRCGHFHHGSTSSPLHWACRPWIVDRGERESTHCSSLPPSMFPSGITQTCRTRALCLSGMKQPVKGIS